MWISKQKWEVLQKRIADLEQGVQSQQKAVLHHLNTHVDEAKQLKIALNDTETNLMKGIEAIKQEIISQVLSEINH